MPVAAVSSRNDDGSAPDLRSCPGCRRYGDHRADIAVNEFDAAVDHRILTERWRMSGQQANSFCEVERGSAA
jgi:hypothetical protein